MVEACKRADLSDDESWHMERGAAKQVLVLASVHRCNGSSVRKALWWQRGRKSVDNAGAVMD